jgi:hypothetical protein
MERHNPFMFQTTNQMVTWGSTIENGPVEKVDLAIKNGGAFHSYVSLPKAKVFPIMGVISQYYNANPVVQPTPGCSNSTSAPSHKRPPIPRSP